MRLCFSHEAKRDREIINRGEDEEGLEAVALREREYV